MASSSNDLRDSVTVELSSAVEPVPERPGERSPKSKWVDYVVALGADRGAAEDSIRPDLIALADRLES